jgi:hypothetical protein
MDGTPAENLDNPCHRPRCSRTGVTPTDNQKKTELEVTCGVATANNRLAKRTNFTPTAVTHQEVGSFPLLVMNPILQWNNLFTELVHIVLAYFQKMKVGLSNHQCVCVSTTNNFWTAW